MPNTIAEYYTDELAEWNRLIVFCKKEMDEFGHKLAEVIEQNTIPDIAAKVENEQDKLNVMSENFKKLQVQIQQQKAALKKDSILIDNTLINTETEKQQNELRHNMQQSEKKYIDTKYECYNFLSEIVKKRKG